jgi:flagellar motor switch protein FliN/FliY
MPGENVADAHIDELVATPETGGRDRPRLGMDDLAAVPLAVAAELGRARTQVRDVLDLKVGSLVTLEKVAGETADVTVNGLVFARGEVVVIGDMLHIRIAELTGGPDRADRNHE